MLRCSSSVNRRAFAAALSALARLSLLHATQINQISGLFCPKKGLELRSPSIPEIIALELYQTLLNVIQFSDWQYFPPHLELQPPATCSAPSLAILLAPGSAQDSLKTGEIALTIGSRI